MAVSKKIPESIHDHTYCPGCGHGVFVRLVHEVMEEKGLLDNNICVLGVGCSATYNRMVYGGNRIEGHHGRGPSTARGAKTILPDTFIWTYQGDGDAYSIGMGETMLAANGDYPITVFVLNNCNYGMTGGQKAQTSLLGQVTTTTPKGNTEPPFNAIPAICSFPHVAYAARGTIVTAKEINKLKKYISKAIDVQMKERKYSIVEVLSPCPTNWHMTPLQAADWVLKEVTQVFPLGEFRDNTAKED